jgi:hypothetical protein
MSKLPLAKLEGRDKEVLLEALDQLILHAESAKVSAQRALTVSDSRYCLGQMAYWKNVHAGFKWARSLVSTSSTPETPTNPPKKRRSRSKTS